MLQYQSKNRQKDDSCEASVDVRATVYSAHFRTLRVAREDVDVAKKAAAFLMTATQALFVFS